MGGPGESTGIELAPGWCSTRHRRRALYEAFLCDGRGALEILKAGGAYLPVDPGYPQAHLSYILADAKVPVAEGPFPEIKQETLEPKLSAEGSPEGRLCEASKPNLPTIICFIVAYGSHLIADLAN